jgi:hypothetical protein
VRQAAWITCALVVGVSVLLLLASGRGGNAWPVTMLVWSTLAAAIVVVAVLIRSRGWVPAAFGSILGFQALMMSYSALPPVRTSKSLVAAIKPFVGADTRLYSVDQYRQSVPPYLGRTLRVVRYRGELDFGLNQDASRFVPTLDAFIGEWTPARNALAFIDPPVMGELRARGVPFQVRAADGRSVVVSRR